MDVERFRPEHLDGPLALCREEQWTTLTEDPARARAALSAPGAVTLVAVSDGELVGFAAAITDGHIQTYLSFLLVAARCRREGIGRRLLERVLADSGAARLDLIATDESHDFYGSFPHDKWAGFRIYPPTG